jgi:hypothetical protein
VEAAVRRRPLYPRSGATSPPSSPFPHIDLSPIDLDAEEKRSRMILRRWDLLFGRAGLVARFERRYGDPLLELREVAELIAGPDFPHAQVIRRFVVDAKLGFFGFRDSADARGYERRGMRDLIDLFNFNQFPPGEYFLRPSLLTVEGAAVAMRATRPTWRRWIEMLGRPVPIELQLATEIEKLQALYDTRVTPMHVPTWAEDRIWAKVQGLTQRAVEALRKNNRDPRLKKRHRRP